MKANEKHPPLWRVFFQEQVILCVFTDKRSEPLILPANMVNQNIDQLVQALKIFHGTARTFDGIRSIADLLFIIYMEGTVCIVVRIMVLLLWLFLIPEVLCDIIGRNSAVSRSESRPRPEAQASRRALMAQTAVYLLRVDQFIAGNQFWCKGIALSTYRRSSVKDFPAAEGDERYPPDRGTVLLHKGCRPNFAEEELLTWNAEKI